MSLAQDECATISNEYKGAVYYRTLGAVEAAKTILSESPNTTKRAATCLKNAMMIVGEARANETIPTLLRWLTWENHERFPFRMDSPAYKFPAIGALYLLGEPALPSLLEVIATHSEKDQLSRNALEAFMSIHKDAPAKGVEHLVLESKLRKGRQSKRLLIAADSAAKSWHVARNAS